MRRLPGLALAVAVAVVATLGGHLAPVVGAPVIGIVLGAVLGAVRRPGGTFRPGLAFSSRTVLQVSVVLLGAQLSVGQVLRVGASSLPVMVGTLAACLGAAYLVGRALGVVGDVRTLIGVGTGICGASAIAAVTPVIGAAAADVAYAVSTIFLFNVAAVLLFPLLGHALGLSQHSFGLFAGTAVNDTSSVVAAATTYGPAATSYAVVVKLVRTLMIIPVSIGLAAVAGRRAADGTVRPSVLRLVPWFLGGFLLLAAANSLGLVPAGAHHPAQVTAAFLITVALSAIGLTTDLAAVRRAGWRPLALGGVLWVVVSATSLGLQAATGSL